MPLNGIVGQSPVGEFLVGGSAISQFAVNGAFQWIYGGDWTSPLLNYSNTGNVYHISIYEDVDEWTPSGASYTLDSSSPAERTYDGVMQVLSGVASISKDLDFAGLPSESLEDYDYFTMYLKRSEENLRRLKLYMGDSTFTNYFVVDISDDIDVIWKLITKQKSDFTQVGSITWATVTKIKWEATP